MVNGSHERASGFVKPQGAPERLQVGRSCRHPGGMRYQRLNAIGATVTVSLLRLPVGLVGYLGTVVGHTRARRHSM